MLMYVDNGVSDANSLVVRLTNLMDAYEASLVAARLERYEAVANVVLPFVVLFASPPLC